MKFKYLETPMGSLADEKGIDTEKDIIQIKRNRIFLDVGNKLQKGVIDHHHRYEGSEDNGKIYRCATSLVSINKAFILDNIDEYANEIEIVLHNSSDFDCYASAFLTENLIVNKDFTYSSNVIERFCEYTDKLDSGMLKIIPDNLEEVYAIGYAIFELQKLKIKQLEKEKSKSEELLQNISEESHEKIEAERKLNDINKKINELYNNLSETVRLRWFRLFEIVMEWLEKNPNKQLEHNNIFINNEEFKEEIDFVRKDYTRYKNVKENKEYFQEIKIRLPKIQDENGKLYLVKGMIVAYIYDENLKEDRTAKELIFTNKENYDIALVKCWLRNDGYIFTIIPKYAEKNYFKEEDKITFKNDENRKIEICQTIISVDPNSGYCLRGLAEVLEEAETKVENYLMEKGLVNGKPFSKRIYNDKSESKTKPRWENDPNFITDDPWYDGRNFKYTIVDAPKYGSLLSFYEIKKYALNYVVSSIHVNDYVLRVVIPFQFSCKYEKLKDIFKTNFKIKTHNCKQGNPCNKSDDYGYCPKDRKEYFLDYIHEYLYNDINNNGKCFHFDFDEKRELSGRNGVIAYHYGTGCFYFTIKINNDENPKNLQLSEFLKKLKSLKEKYKKQMKYI